MRPLLKHFLPFLCLLPLALVTALPALAQAPRCEPAKVATKYPSLAGKTLRIGQDGESPPFSMRDPKNFNHLIGLDADLARAVFACAGVKITFQTGAWSGLLPALMAGQIDAMWDTLLYTPARAEKVDFVSYMNSATGILVPAGNPKHIHSLLDLCGLTAVANLGTTQEAQLRQTSVTCRKDGKPAIDIITATDIPSAMRLVQSGRADAMSSNKFMVARVAQQNPTIYADAFDIRTDALIAVGVAKGNHDLENAVRDGLEVLRQNGTERRIFARYKVDYGLTVAPQILKILTK
ncbi:MAG: ABC transporter substrate-binding protein [Proteobacteria bacterium]|nr:ABC transporter substrate-binding protein [Pseudomonadota bacterium]